MRPRPETVEVRGPEPTNGGTPFRQVLLKIHSRCNLSCDHCYVYRHADQTWRRQPMAMSRRTVDLAAMRIAEHADQHDLPFVTVILHGGEPLLAGPELIEHAACTIRAAVSAHTRVDLRIQTNGLLLDDTYLALFSEQDIRVGVSLDGGPAANDRHRRYANGRGSYHDVAGALRLLGRAHYRHLYGGILCTVDLRNEPLDVYESMLEFEPPRLDFLLPHGNWTSPPPGRTVDGTATPYADWLRAIFDRWYGATRQETQIRLFESLISLLLGGPSLSEAVGLSPIDLLTVETDGSIEQADVLKTSAEGMAATGLHITRDSFDQALAHPMVRARQLGLDALSTTCRACPVVRVCGGGLYAHRYRAQNGFDNPSVYCPDLRALIAHIRDRLDTDIMAINGNDESTRAAFR